MSNRTVIVVIWAMVIAGTVALGFSPEPIIAALLAGFGSICALIATIFLITWE